MYKQIVSFMRMYKKIVFGKSSFYTEICDETYAVSRRIAVL